MSALHFLHLPLPSSHVKTFAQLRRHGSVCFLPYLNGLVQHLTCSRSYCGRCERWFCDGHALHQHLKNHSDHFYCEVCRFDGWTWDQLVHHHRTTPCRAVTTHTGRNQNYDDNSSDGYDYDNYSSEGDEDVSNLRTLRNLWTALISVTGQ